MNPRDYTTWTRFEDHPVFTDQKTSPAEWSSDPKMYEDFRLTGFDPEWYVHRDPKLPVEFQAMIAERDMKNLTAACELIQNCFGSIDHELFILDDLTVLVRITSRNFTLDLYPSYFEDEGKIIDVFVDDPVDEEFSTGSVHEIVGHLKEIIQSEE